MTSILAVCRWLHSRGLDIGVVNRNGHSAVHKAALHGNRPVCEWLLGAAHTMHEYGEAVTGEAGRGSTHVPPRLSAAVHMQPDRDGSTPSRLARAHEHNELAAWLEKLEFRGDA